MAVVTPDVPLLVVVPGGNTGLAAGLGVEPHEVNSPSFVLINEYTAGREHGGIPIYHADLYRVETAHDLATGGLEDCLSGDGVCIVEWAERAAAMLPQDRLEIAIAETGPTARRFSLRSYGPRYHDLVAGLLSEHTDAARA